MPVYALFIWLSSDKNKIVPTDDIPTEETMYSVIFFFYCILIHLLYNYAQVYYFI